MFQEYLKERLSLYKENIAIKNNDRYWLYSDLLQIAYSITGQLLDFQIQKEEVVALWFDKRESYIFSVIGTMGAGACFMPIDPSLPISRVSYMLEEVGCTKILCDDKIQEKLSQNSDQLPTLTIINIEEKNNSDREHGIEQKVEFSPEDKIYIYFTSGSSGKPKAIIGKNKSLHHFINWEINQFELKPGYQFSQLVSVGFDAFLRDIFVPLCSGSTINIYEGGFDTSLKDWANSKGINVIHCVPSIFRQILRGSLKADMLSGLKYVFLSGEPVYPTELKDWFKVYGENITLVNLYGATETTMTKTFYIIKPDDVNRTSIPVGKPMAGARVLILDQNNRLCKPMIEGELYIRTPFMTHGYWKKELNEGKFVDNPLLPAGQEKIYKTGDRGKYLIDGNIELKGRVDRQLKINGVRIEPEEIESICSSHPDVKEIVVGKEMGKDGQYGLICYVVPQGIEESRFEGLTDQLKIKLLKHLPEAFIPARFIRLESFPRLFNGKIDHQHLKSISSSGAHAQFVEPENSTEARLLEIWKEVFRIDKVSVESSFFEAGGHSLLVNLLVQKIQESFRVKLSIQDVYINTSIRKQSKIIVDRDKVRDEPVPCKELREYYPLSPSQNRFYFLHSLNVDDKSYNITNAFEIKGKLDPDRLNMVVEKLIQRHGCLRTGFFLHNEVPVQRIFKSVEFSISFVESTFSQLQGAVKSLIHSFQLDQPPLFRVGVVKIEENRNYLVFDIHHIIVDGLSLEILIKDFIALYNDDVLQPLKIQYSDYACWLNHQIKNGRIQRKKDFWYEQFAESIPKIQLPLDYTRPSVKSNRGASIKFDLDKSISGKLYELSREEEVSVFLLLLSYFKLLLAKISQANDVVVGVPVAGRQLQEVMNVVGVFINTLPIRSIVDEDASFIQFIQKLNTDFAKALDFQDYPYEKLVDDLDLERDMSRNPLFDVMFVFQAKNQFEGSINGLQLKPYKFEEQHAKLDLSLIAREHAEGISLELNYSTKLFSEDTIIRIKNQLEYLISETLSYPDRKISSVEIILPDEKQTILNSFNNTAAPYPKEKTLHQLFEEQARDTPDNVALIFEGETMSYEELDKKSSSLAAYLQSMGVGAEVPVGILCNRSFEMIIGILGILKAGGAYVPLDPAYPEKRLEFILNDSNIGIMLVSQEDEICSGHECKRVKIADGVSYKGKLVENVDSQNLAYIIYTSGSTGQPKGVQIEHHSAVNRLMWMQKQYPVNSDDTLIQKTPYSFDVSVWEIFWWFIGGSKLLLLPNGGEKDPDLLVEEIAKNKITTIHFVPSMLQVFLKNLSEDAIGKVKSLKQVFCSGEALTKYQEQLFGSKLYQNNATRLINLYGPTEATVDVSYYNCFEKDDLDFVPIGKPIDNIQLYILDANDNLLPIGVQGELCIGGVGVSRGYLNRDDLNREKFVDNPFQKGDKIYKTGDLARWLVDGNIEYLGRKDHQVKIRGHRIELGEIECELLKLDQISEVAVTVHAGNEGVNELVCYYISENIAEPEEIREHLLEVLPAYMIPAMFIRMDQFPLTNNGKLDRKQLPKPDITTAQTNYVEPKTELEKAMANLWSQVLGRKISVKDNFFASGGDSLKAISIASRIEKEFGYKPRLTTILSNQTIEKLLHAIKDKIRLVNGGDNFPKAETKEYYPLSRDQERLYVANKLFPDNTTYNVPVAFRLEGEFKLDKIKSIFKGLMERHEVLRTNIVEYNDIAYQKVCPVGELNIKEVSGDRSDYNNLVSDYVEPFTLEEDSPLWRMVVIKLNNNSNSCIILVDFHHIIIDGISKQLLLKEFIALYRGQNLESQKYQYKDFSEWQRRFVNTESYLQQKHYWLNKFSNLPKHLKLPLDFARPEIQTFKGKIVSQKLDDALNQKLYAYLEENEVTNHAFMIAITNVLLNKYTGQEDIIVGSDTSGRRSVELENVTGFFTGQVAYRNNPTDIKTFNEFISEVMVNSLEAIENQDYPFNQLISDLGLSGSFNANPLFDVFVTITGMKMKVENNEQELDDTCRFIPIQTVLVPAIRDIQFNIDEHEQGTTINIIYNDALFKEGTCHKMLSRFVSIMKQVLDDDNIKLGEINMVSELTHVVSRQDKKVESDFAF